MNVHIKSFGLKLAQPKGVVLGIGNFLMQSHCQGLVFALQLPTDVYSQPIVSEPVTMSRRATALLGVEARALATKILEPPDSVVGLEIGVKQS
jgi:hypothetical protein